MITTQAKEKASVTLADIAREVGVSRAVVGKVLGTGSNNIRVGKEKAERIRETARRLNYRPNLSARALTGQKINLIGVLIDTEAPQVHRRILTHVDRQTSRRGYRILMGEAHENIDSLRRHYESFLQYHTDAVLCFAHNYPGHEAELRELFGGRPNIVFIDRPMFEDVSYVELDREATIADLVRRLCRTRQRVGLVAESPGFVSVRSRIDGYKRGLREADRAFDPALLHGLGGYVVEPEATMERVVEKFVLPARLDAVIAPNDITAAYMMRALMKRGVRIPGDVALVGTDNDLFSGALTPSLTTIDDNCELIARYAVEMLLESTESNEPQVVKTVKVTPRVVVRESTGLLPEA